MSDSWFWFFTTLALDAVFAVIPRYEPEVKEPPPVVQPVAVQEEKEGNPLWSSQP